MGIVIIGAGHAGMQSAIFLRDSGYEKEITLIGDEKILPYQRPPLSKLYMQGEIDLDHMLLRKESLYEKRKVTLKMGTKVVGIDKVKKLVMLADDCETISYDKLILATGAFPARLPIVGNNLPHVHVLRSIEDADHMVQALQNNPKNIIVIGGGFIGLEVAASLKKMGRSVEVLTNARLMERAVCQDVSDFYDQLHRSNGVVIHYITNIEKITPEAIFVDGKTIPADMVVMGVGVKPNVELAESASLAVKNGGFLTNFYGRCVDDPDIYAIGDCASFPMQWADDCRDAGRISTKCNRYAEKCNWEYFEE